jgi:hypothetical protein
MLRNFCIISFQKSRTKPFYKRNSFTFSDIYEFYPIFLYIKRIIRLISDNLTQITIRKCTLMIKNKSLKYIYIYIYTTSVRNEILHEL